jgi:CelD/BcsL family acetyltransferase involved in cellulose biosynthesis
VIPQVFHWVWLGGEPLPDHRRQWIDGWLTLHPDWEHVLWTDENLPVLVNQQQFERAHSNRQRADIARYELLYRHGGVYLDTDVECVAGIEPLLEGVEACIASDDGLKQLGTSLMAAEPGHAWLADLVSAIPSRVGIGRSTSGETGSVFATSMTVGRPTVTVLPESVVRRSGQALTGDTRAIHHVPAEPVCVESLLPPGSVVAVSDKNSERMEAGRRYIPFPERNGEWAGYPAGDEEALAELARLKSLGAAFLVVPGRMFYFLNAYPRLTRFLWQNERCVLDSESALIFALEAQVQAAAAPAGEGALVRGHAAPSAWNTTVISTLSALRALVPEWRQLAASCAPTSIFQFPEWVVPWWEAFGAGRELRVLAIYDGPRLAGVLPLASGKEDAHLEFVGEPLNDRNGMLAAADDLAEAWKAALDELCRLEGWISLEFRPAPDGDVRACLLAVDSAMVSLLPPILSPIVELPSTWEAYLARLPKNRRRQWFSGLDRLSGAHEVELVCLTGSAITEQQLLDFHARRNEQWTRTGRYEELPELERSSAYPRFLADAGTALARIDHLLLTHLLVDGRPVASYLVPRWGGTTLDYMKTYDPRFARYRPGMLCTLLSLERIIADGYRTHDFGRGPEPYKLAFGAVRREWGGIRIRR